MEKQAEYKTGNNEADEALEMLGKGYEKNLWPLHMEDIGEEFSLNLIVRLAAPVVWPDHKTSAIYFLLDENEIVYIGKTTDLRSRFIQHSKTNKVFNRYFYIFCDRDNLTKTEALLIRKFNPKYNISIPKEPK